MTFETFEESRQRGEPIFLYLFEYDDGQVRRFAYTDHEQDVVAPASTGLTGVTFSAVPIEHGGLKSSGSLDKATFGINMAHDTPLAAQFRNYPPGQVVNVTVWQNHVGDTAAECLVVWAGRITSCSFEGSIASIQCEPVSTSLRRPALRRHYQIGCPHELYGPHCLANRAAGTLTNRAVVDVAGNVVTLASGWKASPHPVEAYVGGQVEWTTGDGTNVRRTVLRIESGNIVFLNGPTPGLTPGMSVNVVVGCNRQRSHCSTIHNNILNYGGCPYIPTTNPFGFTMNYY